MAQTIVAPNHIGSYNFKKTIGEGAFSVVKLAQNESTGDFYACKIVPRASLSSKELQDRFESEIRINQQLHHDGIVQIVDLFSDQFNYYVFMEFCPNGELFKFICDSTRLKEDQSKILLKQVLEALAYLHSLGVAHRDLKPENLLFDPYSRLKISDFGLSRFVASNGLVNTPCGSPCYASPECVSGLPYDGRKSDMWSLGVILYAMVTGNLPWTKRNQEALFKQIRNGEYTIPSYLSSECSDLIKSLMCIDPNKRLSASEALQHPFLSNANDKFGIQNPKKLQIISLKKVDMFFASKETDSAPCTLETVHSH